MFPSKSLKTHRKKLLILGVIAWGLFLAGPTVKWLWPGNWWGTSLIVLMNENEARPCGGFVTAYGTVKLPFGGASLQNSFAFPPVNLGQNMQPLRAVSVERKFWDLGTSLNQDICAEQFAQAYEQAVGKKANRVILAQSGVIEAWLAALGSIQVEAYQLDKTNFFATTSRLVADVDRHDETILAERKNPLGSFGKKLLLSTVLRPWRWYGVTRSFGRAEETGSLYWHKPGKSSIPAWEKEKNSLVTISEWNLGGGKSSRYLDKQWRLNLRQRTPDLWDLEVSLEVQHLGGEDEPLSQDWKGGFELQVLSGTPIFIPAEIAPGKSFSYAQSFPLGSRGLQGAEGNYDLSVYTPVYQNWQTTVQISALGQQVLIPHSKSLVGRENTATWQGKTNPAAQNFNFILEPDKIAPFLTWHKPISSLNVSAQNKLNLQNGGRDLIVELHFNEPVELMGRTPARSSGKEEVFRGEALGIRLIDRDYAVKARTENPQVKTALLLPDKQTLLLNVSQEVYQKNERFYLEIDAVVDMWGNKADIKKRTIITR